MVTGQRLGLGVRNRDAAVRTRPVARLEECSSGGGGREVDLEANGRWPRAVQCTVPSSQPDGSVDTKVDDIYYSAR